MKINEVTAQRFLIGAIILSALVSIYVYLPVFVPSSQFVTFDTHKFINAQRVVTNELLSKKNRESDVLFMQQEVSNQAKKVILDIADGAHVLSKQAYVIDGVIPDITDQVLERLGLPTNVDGHNAILIKSVESVEKRFSEWKPYTKTEKPIEKETSPMDLLP